MPITSNIFSKYKNEHSILVETGSYRGDGIQAALDAGFSKVHSVELTEHYLNFCKARFYGNSSVKLWQGESFEVLNDLLSTIDEPVTFWLDAHYSCADTGLGQYWAPLIQELEVIQNHSIKTHTIIIDDMNCWELPNPVHKFWSKDIFSKLNEINPDYKFRYEKNQEILVAFI